jgi:hypothetical protein
LTAILIRPAELGVRQPAGQSKTGSLGKCFMQEFTDLAVSFCEEDYVITLYLAEFVNALTNVTYGMS